MRFSLLFSLFVATLLSTSHARCVSNNHLRLPRRQSTGAAAVSADEETYKINCQSFRVGAEANNVRDWYTVPSYCKSYIKTYLEKKQYGLDVEAVVVEAIAYADTFSLDVGPKDIWVLDVEDTLISNLNYLTGPLQYGTNPIDSYLYYEWLKNNTIVSLPSMRDLYNELVADEFGIVLLSGAPESFREDFEKILEGAGYSGWTQLILKGDGNTQETMLEFKSTKRRQLEEYQKYRIVGNVGDQWTDLSGENVGLRTFKVPNPVYYTA